MSRPIVIIAAPGMAFLEIKIGQSLRDLGRDAETLIFHWGHFPDGEPDVVIGGVQKIHGAHVVFLANFSANNGSIMEQIGLMYAMSHYGAYSLTVVIPYFPGTLDRVDVPGRLVWSKTLARMLSAIPPCFGAGPARIVIYDIHAQQTQLTFGDGVACVFLDALQHDHGVFHGLWRQLESWSTLDNPPLICFPDAGARKRYEYLARGKPTIVCEKRRGSGNERELHVVDGDPGGRIVLIVDDLVMSGRTILECARLMRERGARCVDALCVHGVLPSDAVERINAASPQYLSTLHVTDTIPRVTELAGDRITVHSIAPQLSQWLVEHID